MFDGISKQYDFLNRVISLGIDIKWRKRVVAMMKKDQPQRLMDIATGTGDLALALTDTGASEIIGLDISPGMLEVGKQKVNASLRKNHPNGYRRYENLDYPDDYFDGITVAFGVRNFEHLKRLGRDLKVLKPKGRLIV